MAEDDRSKILERCRPSIGDHDYVEVVESWAGIHGAAKRFDADVIFPTLTAPRRSEIPAVGYIYDFQHKHLAQYFSVFARVERDLQFARIAAHAHALVVNSLQVKHDVLRWLKFPPERILALPFSPYFEPDVSFGTGVETAIRYGLTGPYVIVCNQLWLHKDHATALRAFAKLVAGGAPVEKLVVTGSLVDWRNPGHADEMRRLAADLGIQDRVAWLGYIPKADQLSLLRHATFLWQPTLFEGGPGGGSVYEAVGLGVPSIVSDIEVNREISSDLVTFFRAGDADSLTKVSAELLVAPRIRPTPGQLRERNERSLGQLGAAIMSFLRSLV